MTRVVTLSNSFDDAHVAAVHDEISRRGGEAVRLDIDRVVRGEISFSWNPTSDRAAAVRVDGAEINLDSFDSVWYRKPFGFAEDWGFVESVRDPAQRSLLAGEVTALMNGVLALMDGAFWLNHPHAIAGAETKLHQLELAREFEVPTPPSIVTNDPDIARAFCRGGRTVFKPLTHHALKYGAGTTYHVDTTLVTDALMARLELIRHQPVLLQRLVDKRCELRAIYVGGEFFVAEQTVARDQVENWEVDWRALQGTARSCYRRGDLPRRLQDNIGRLLEHMDLGFAAVDLAVDEDGDVYFLEINPNGQWLGYAREAGLPVAGAIADRLVHMSRTRTEGGES